MREGPTPRRRGLLFTRIRENDPHIAAVVVLNELFEEMAQAWPLGKKKSLWDRMCYEPLVDVGAAEAWFEKWIGELKDD